MTALLVSILGLVIGPVVNVAAMAAVSLCVARAFGVEGARLLFHYPPREQFDAKSRWAFPTTVAAGPVASYLCIAALLLGSFLLGDRAVYDGTVDVVPNGRAAAAGLRSGDRIVVIDGSPIAKFDDIKPALAGRAETHLIFVVERGSERLTFDVVTDHDVRVQVKASAPRREPIPVSDALTMALTSPPRILVGVASGFLALLGPSREPVAVVNVVPEMSRAAQGGAAQLLGALAVLNVYYWPVTLIVAYVVRPRRRPPPPEEGIASP